MKTSKSRPEPTVKKPLESRVRKLENAAAQAALLQKVYEQGHSWPTVLNASKERAEEIVAAVNEALRGDKPLPAKALRAAKETIATARSAGAKDTRDKIGQVRAACERAGGVWIEEEPLQGFESIAAKASAQARASHNPVMFSFYGGQEIYFVLPGTEPIKLGSSLNAALGNGSSALRSAASALDDALKKKAQDRAYRSANQRSARDVPTMMQEAQQKHGKDRLPQLSYARGLQHRQEIREYGSVLLGALVEVAMKTGGLSERDALKQGVKNVLFLSQGDVAAYKTAADWRSTAQALAKQNGILWSDIVAKT